MASDEVLIQTAISSWEQVIKRVGTLCLSCSEEQLLVEVAPAKSRISYLWGHLTAVNDAMFGILRLGERLHPELDAVFIAQPVRPPSNLDRDCQVLGGCSHRAPCAI